MTKNTWYFVVGVIVIVAVVFYTNTASAQFQPCVWPRTC